MPKSTLYKTNSSKLKFTSISIIKISMEAIERKFNKTKRYTSHEQKIQILEAFIKINDALVVFVENVPKDCLG